MKHLKMLIIGAAAAMTLTALFGVGSASATVLCKKWARPCPEKYPKNTVIGATLETGTSVVFRETTGGVLLTCTGATIEAKVTEPGGPGKPVEGDLQGLGFTGCAGTHSVLENGLFLIHYKGPNTEGTTTIQGTSITIESFGEDCIYGTGEGTTHVGPMTSMLGMESPTVDFAAVLTRESGGALCATDIVWEGKYVITAPKPLYFKSE